MNYSNQKEYQASQKKKIPVSKIKGRTGKFYKDLSKRSSLTQSDLQKFTNTICKDLGIVSTKIVFSGKEKASSRNGKIVSKTKGHINPKSKTIKVYKETAKTGKARSNKAVLGTLLHELIHYIDFVYFGFSHSPHTAGFFKRISQLQEKLEK